MDRLKHAIETVTPIVLAGLPHDETVFTQGLSSEGQNFFESAGLYGRSSLRKLDPAGTVLAQVALGDGFAEGIAIRGNELVQLTWREETAIRYSLETLERLGTFSYRGEGWGLAANPTGFIMSDGSDQLVQRDECFKAVRMTRVRLAGRPVSWLNDLEAVGNKVYANVWGADFLLEIDYPAGNVSRIVDCGELRELAGQGGVLNGVAYQPETGTFLLTGKNWRYLFKVEIPMRR